MANINLYELYNNKRRKFGITDSSRYQEAFVESVNNAFATFNGDVFQADTLEYISNFNDIISSRLNSFTTMTFNADSCAAMSGREYWAIEYHLERKHSTNTLVDTITDGASNVVITISDWSINIAGDTISDFEIPDVDAVRVLISSNKSGITVLADDLTCEYTTDETISLDDVPDLDWVPDVEIIPSLGDTDTSQAIGTVSSRVIGTVAGLDLISTAFYSSKSKLFEFLMNEGTGSTVNSYDYLGSTTKDEGYTATIADEDWVTNYVEDSCGLDRKYLPYFNATLEYYLQEGGEWAIEPDLPLEAQMQRNIIRARSKYQNDLTFYGYLGDLS